MDRIHFDADDAPSVLTAIHPECRCEGHADWSSVLTLPEYGEERIFALAVATEKAALKSPRR